MNDKGQMKSPRGSWVTDHNLIECSIYIAVCHVIPATWLNDRDQFLYPNDGWKNDYEFQSDCLVYTLFNNNIQSRYGTNHWIPFTEEEVGAQEAFDSHFMSDFLRGGVVAAPRHPDEQPTLFAAKPLATKSPATIGDGWGGAAPIDCISPEAKATLDAGRELWRYYHRSFTLSSEEARGGGTTPTLPSMTSASTSKATRQRRAERCR